ncbi:MAG: UDP-2,3-diacylglucosamine diphosphatase [Gammaproteobacteria bacterium]|nr:UDP-2,3-diacylglucosamine diphosphatase [Gammaproteobacteria bacterium]MYH45446.1 UDP-2,3-diacylglucosamine diphosphatase [Gammaproteobacteria bacterium]MYL14867.1 UDP-2,3-diacylglucosamine diphosphatase [Gammaproteobacteria bacterium]
MAAPAVPDSPVILISDLHLQESRPDITRAFVDFVAAVSAACRRFFILGDLFELWIGDDAESALADEVAASLQALAARGVKIHLMHGNRDFLIGDDYAARCGGELISEPFELEVDGAHWLLLHGDALCIDDTGYMEFRRMVRNPAWQREFLSQPLAERQAWADRAREQSQVATAGKPAEIMDVNHGAVLDLIRDSGRHRILHGHTHRPAVHELPEAGPRPDEPALRVVLGDWDRQGWYAAIDGARFTLRNFPLESGASI